MQLTTGLRLSVNVDSQMEENYANLFEPERKFVVNTAAVYSNKKFFLTRASANVAEETKTVIEPAVSLLWRSSA